MPRRKKGLATKLQREKEQRERRLREEEDRQLREIRQLQEEKDRQLQEEKDRQLKEKEERELQDKEEARAREEKRLKRKEKRRIRKKWANWHAPRVGDRVLYRDVEAYGEYNEAYLVTGIKTGESITIQIITDELCDSEIWEGDSSDEDSSDEDLDPLTLSWEEAILEPSLWEFWFHDPRFICNPFCRHLENKYLGGGEGLLNELIEKTFVLASENIIYSKKRCRHGKKCQDTRVGHLVNFSHVHKKMKNLGEK